MHDLMPKRLISKQDLNKWELYSSELKNYKFINKHLGNILSKWVQKLENPLEIDWIQQLFLSRLDYLDEMLNTLEKLLGEKNLQYLLDEIRDQGGTAEALNEKIKSIQGEIQSFIQLTNLKNMNIRKIAEVGDWETETKIISVKTLSDIDQNYQIIENKIRSLHFIKEYSTLRKYNHIRLLNQSGLDYHFRSQINKFLQLSFMDAIKFVDETTPAIFNPLNFSQPGSNKQGVQISQTRIQVYREIKPNEEYIIFFIHNERQDEENEQKHEITIKLESYPNTPKNSFSFFYDTHAFSSNTPININKLMKQVQLKILMFDNNCSNNDTNKVFHGWINIPISPLHQKYVMNNLSQIKKSLFSLKENRSYEIFICLLPQFGFEMKEPIIFPLES